MLLFMQQFLTLKVIKTTFMYMYVSLECQSCECKMHLFHLQSFFSHIHLYIRKIVFELHLNEFKKNLAVEKKYFIEI